MLRVAHFAVLPLVHGRVDALLLQELLVRTVLRDFALVHHEYLVAPDNSAMTGHSFTHEVN